jgi:hypothetical protein
MHEGGTLAVLLHLILLYKKCPRILTDCLRNYSYKTELIPLGMLVNTHSVFCLPQGDGHLVEGARQCVEFMLGF